MKLSKTKKGILISALKQKELFALLKCQIAFDFIFTNSDGVELEELRLVITDRTIESNLQVITSNGAIISYKGLLDEISENAAIGLHLSILMKTDTFRKNEPLIALSANIKDAVVESCVSIAYDKEIYTITNKPFRNGDSDKLIYFEANDSILAFVEDGPVILTNPKINSINDVICN